MEQSGEQSESRLQLDKRGEDGEMVQLRFGAPAENREQQQGAVATGDQGAGPSLEGARIRPFDGLNAASSSGGDGRGAAANAGGMFQAPAKKKSKVLDMQLHAFAIVLAFL